MEQKGLNYKINQALVEKIQIVQNESDTLASSKDQMISELSHNISVLASEKESLEKKFSEMQWIHFTMQALKENYIGYGL